mmetsp:Transcript_93002/g.252309  ORF Transcript_93002/g.252309 Transcript_93002/m.252309 type:complete len:81 (-) Transcript_93002:103-345(-)
MGCNGSSHAEAPAQPHAPAQQKPARHDGGRPVILGQAGEVDGASSSASPAKTHRAKTRSVTFGSTQTYEFQVKVSRSVSF